MVGGLVGYMKNSEEEERVVRCYSTGRAIGSTAKGGLIGQNDKGEVLYSYWDIQTSSTTTSSGGIGKSTNDMKSRNTYDNWACSHNWTLNDNIDYPKLYWQNASGTRIGNNWFSGGNGSKEDPYLVNTPEQLNRIGVVDCLLGMYYKQIADIDLSKYDGKNGRPTFNLIGSYSKPFYGLYDGNGYAIINFTYASTSSNEYVGLFRYIQEMSGGYLLNVKMKNVNVDVPNSKHVGALVGGSFGLLNCSVEGGMVRGSQNVGGIVGTNGRYTINMSHSSVEVIGSSNVGGVVGQSWSGNIFRCSAKGPVSGNRNVGGVVGYCYNTYQIYECYAFGNVSATGSNASYHGGLAGYSDYVIADSYAKGNVSGRTSVGGLVGYISDKGVRHCYSTGLVTSSISTTSKGGLIGSGSPIVSGSFWDISTSGIGTSKGGVGLSTAQMKDINTFISAGWDMIEEIPNGKRDTWRLCNSGSMYPRLNWEYLKSDFACPDGVSIDDLLYFSNHWLESNLDPYTSAERTGDRKSVY